MNDELPDHDTMRAAVALAARAPSVFNIQPWQWRIGDTSLHLLLDRTRVLPVTDPAGRELTVSCGAALHHAILALQALGWRVHVHRVPNPATPDRLAAIEVLGPDEPSAAAVALAGAACFRRTDRRQYAPEAVPTHLLHELVAAGEQAGAQVLVAEGEHRYALATAFAKAAELHGALEEYRDELAVWTARGATAEEGVPQATAPQPGTQYGDLVLRDFGRVAVAHEEVGSPRTVGSILLISTAADDPKSHLLAGEAAGAILCAAELEALASSPLSEAFEIDQTRSAVRREVLADAAYPQLALRIGWPAVSRKPPSTYRRPVRELLHELLDDGV